MYENAKAADEWAERRDEEAQLRAERREEEVMQHPNDARTMSVDAFKFFPLKRHYWENKHKRILDLVDIAKESSAPEPP